MTKVTTVTRVHREGHQVCGDLKMMCSQVGVHLGAETCIELAKNHKCSFKNITVKRIHPCCIEILEDTKKVKKRNYP